MHASIHCTNTLPDTIYPCIMHTVIQYCNVVNAH